MRSFDEQITIEELYDADDYMEWLIAMGDDRDATESFTAIVESISVKVFKRNAEYARVAIVAPISKVLGDQVLANVGRWVRVLDDTDADLFEIGVHDVVPVPGRILNSGRCVTPIHHESGMAM